MTIGVFPGYAGIAHGIFALVTFSAEAAAAIMSYSILQDSRSMQYISIALGSIAAMVLLSATVQEEKIIMVVVYSYKFLEREEQKD